MTQFEFDADVDAGDGEIRRRTTRRGPPAGVPFREEIHESMPAPTSSRLDSPRKSASESVVDPECLGVEEFGMGALSAILVTQTKKRKPGQAPAGPASADPAGRTRARARADNGWECRV